MLEWIRGRLLVPQRWSAICHLLKPTSCRTLCLLMKNILKMAFNKLTWMYSFFYVLICINKRQIVHIADYTFVFVLLLCFQRSSSFRLFTAGLRLNSQLPKRIRSSYFALKPYGMHVRCIYVFFKILGKLTYFYCNFFFYQKIIDYFILKFI